METVYYSTLFLLSLALTAVYMLFWRKHDDVNITLVFALIPINNLGYVFLSYASSLESALFATWVSYMGGCFLELFIMFAIFSLCKIRLNRWLRLGLLLLSMGVYLSSLTMGQNTWFYTHVDFPRLDGTVGLIKEYGPLHTLFYVMVIGYFAVSTGVIVYSFLHKSQISRKILLLLFLPQVVCMLAFFGGRHFFPGIELIPAAYIFAQIVYLLIVWRISLYNVTEMVVDAMAESGDTGFIIFDSHCRYLGCNETALQILPGLAGLTVDLSLKRSPEMEQLLLPWLQQFGEHPDDAKANEHFYEKDGRIYRFEVGSLSERRAKRGFRIVVTDDTLDRAYIRLLNGYNRDLQQEVEKKTERIVRMQDHLILSLAVMVEGRDNSTGGHIRRTSEVVRMLIDALRAQELPPIGYPLTEEFCRMLIKAAPMHDLGKIAVDDSILRKPGRFTPEEYEQMKRHAAEGAHIVHEILKGDDEAFHHLAENVAHYHHERWDGSGYPEGLKGEQIPPEARIMAVADVYDALVSKRVYKEKLSFERADAIMREGMGSQFDPALEPAYLAARPALEAYYTALDREESTREPAAAVCC